MKRVNLIIAALVATTFLLTIFLEVGYNASEGNFNEKTILLRDGRTVTCVVYSDYQGGGLSCDWEGARR